MIITSILTLIGLCGTLAIIAYLRQVEDAMAELQEQLDVPVCPICNLAHHPHEDTKMHTSSLRGIRSYCKRQRRAATRLYSARSLSHGTPQRR